MFHRLMTLLRRFLGGECEYIRAGNQLIDVRSAALDRERHEQYRALPPMRMPRKVKR